MQTSPAINEGLPDGPYVEKQPNGLWRIPEKPMITRGDLIRINVLLTSRRGLGVIDAALIWRIVELNSESCDPIGGSGR